MQNFKSSRKCVVQGCEHNWLKDRTLSFFGLPKDESRLQEWCRILEIDVDAVKAQSGKTKRLVCEDHFDDSQFVGALKTQLKPGALPRPPEGAVGASRVEFGCSVGNCKWRERATSLHPIPLRPAEIRAEWINFVRVTRGEYWMAGGGGCMSLLCNLHFEKDCFEDNTSHLKPTAIPTIRESSCPELESNRQGEPAVDNDEESVRTENTTSSQVSSDDGNAGTSIAIPVILPRPETNPTPTTTPFSSSTVRAPVATAAKSAPEPTVPPTVPALAMERGATTIGKNTASSSSTENPGSSRRKQILPTTFKPLSVMITAISQSPAPVGSAAQNAPEPTVPPPVPALSMETATTVKNTVPPSSTAIPGSSRRKQILPTTANPSPVLVTTPPQSGAPMATAAQSAPEPTVHPPVPAPPTKPATAMRNTVPLLSGSNPGSSRRKQILTATSKPLPALIPSTPAPILPIPGMNFPITAQVQFIPTSNMPVPPLPSEATNSHVTAQEARTVKVEATEATGSRTTAAAQSNVFKYKDLVPWVMNFCLICNTDFTPGETVDSNTATKVRHLLASFLGIELGQDNTDEGKHFLCSLCNYKVLDLQETLDQVMAKQRELEQQRDALLKDIVQTFCKRLNARGDHRARTFTSADAVHKAMVDQWASKLTLPVLPPRRPPVENTENIVAEVIEERRRIFSDKRKAEYREKQLERAAELDVMREERQEKKRRKEERKRHVQEAKQQKSLAKQSKPSTSDNVGIIKKRKRDRTRLACPVCGLEMLVASLKWHIQTHSGQKNHKCNICGRSFLRKDALFVHKQSHKIGEASFGDWTRRYLCQFCDQWIWRGRKLFEHIADHHQNDESRQQGFMYYNCDLAECNCSINNEQILRQHLLEHSEVPLECPTCSRAFASAENLERHSQVHSQENVFPCSYCQEVFEQEVDLETHSILHLIKVDPDVFTFVCDLCGKKFVHAIDLHVHRSTTHREGPGYTFADRYQVVMCETCGKSFHSVTNLQLHSYVHTHPEGFTCSGCQRVFPNPTRLLRHEKSGQCGKEPVVTVAKKSKPTSTKSSTEPRERRTEPKQRIKKPPKPKAHRFGQKKKYGEKNCEHCGFRTTGVHLYRRHLVVHHPDLAPGLPCKVCWRNFATEQELEEHEKIHERLRCKVCNKLCGHIERLRLHMRIHTGEKPYSCRYCDKKFNLEPNLREHEYRHTGERPYKCNICSEGFIRKKQRDQHVEKVHSNVPQPVTATTSSARVTRSSAASSGSKKKHSKLINAPSVATGQNPLIDFSNFILDDEDT